MKIAIAAFAKTPGLSAVKTRLVADIGREQAEAFYGLSVSAIEEVLVSAKTQDVSIFPHWALAEQEAIDRQQWQRLPSLWTGEGGLGERLATVSEALFETHDGVVLIGTDSPQINTARLLEAVECLKSNPDNYVVGPALDGGFYLFASIRPVRREIWENVTYSAESTLEELLSKLESTDAKIHRLNAEQDVDEASDLTMLATRLSKEDDLLPAQRSLLEWLEQRIS